MKYALGTCALIFAFGACRPTEPGAERDGGLYALSGAALDAGAAAPDGAGAAAVAADAGEDTAGGPGAACDDWRPDGIIGPAGLLRSTKFRLCQPGLTCEIPSGACGGPGSTTPGTCVARPTSCSAGGTPACGCDRRSYDSDCARMAAGVALASVGVCPPAVRYETCAGDKRIRCGDGLFCDVRTCFPTEDTVGECDERPAACTKEYEPVCACDGKTYDNDCLRRAAAVARQQVGICGVDCYGIQMQARTVLADALASVPQCGVTADCSKIVLLPGSGACLGGAVVGGAEVAAAVAAHAGELERLCDMSDAGKCGPTAPPPPAGPPPSGPIQCQAGKCVYP